MLNWTNQDGGYEAIQVWRNGEMIEENIGGDQESYVDLLVGARIRLARALVRSGNTPKIF